MRHYWPRGDDEPEPTEAPLWFQLLLVCAMTWALVSGAFNLGG